MSKEKEFFNFDGFEVKDFTEDEDKNIEKCYGHEVEEKYDGCAKYNFNEKKNYDCYEEKHEEYKPDYGCREEKYEEYRPHYECREEEYEECRPHYECKEEKHEECRPHYECKEEKHEECRPHYECRKEEYEECRPHHECREEKHDQCGCHDRKWECEDEHEECYKKAELHIHKEVDKCVAMKCDILRYSIVIKNVGNTDACNVVLKDCLSKGLKYVPGSLEINGKCVDACRELDELVLGTICPGREIRICFSAKIVEECDDEVKNYAFVCYWYMPHRCSKPVKERKESNVVVTKILQPRVIIEKFVDKEEAKVGDELNYKIIVKNCGKVKAENFVLKDELDCSLKCLHVSVKGSCFEKPVCCEDLKCGINLGDIEPGKCVEVCIKAKIVCPVEDCFVRNRATGSYMIHCIKLHAEGSNEVKTRVKLHVCRTDVFEDIIKVPCSKGPVSAICKKHAGVKLLEVKEVKETEEVRVYRIKVATKVCFEYKKECGQIDCICKECVWEKDLCLPRCYKYGKNFKITVCPDGLQAKVRCGFDIMYKLGVEVCLKND